jgi:hypothetical protein
MELQHVNVKIFLEGELPFDPSRFINIFHGWIQESLMPELLIDVADYCHVPDGPGVLLVAHEADYSMDHTDGRWGLRYNRKAIFPGNNEDRLRQALSAAANACARLEAQFAADTGLAGLRFSRTQFEILINDRALAPNNPETFAEFESELRPCLQKLLVDNPCTLQVPRDARRRVAAVVTAARPFDLAALRTADAPSGPAQS